MLIKNQAESSGSESDVAPTNRRQVKRRRVVQSMSCESIMTRLFKGKNQLTLSSFEARYPDFTAVHQRIRFRLRRIWRRSG